MWVPTGSWGGSVEQGPKGPNATVEKFSDKAKSTPPSSCYYTGGLAISGNEDVAKSHER